MYVGVIHHIYDPVGFQEAEAKALEAGLPPEFGLPIHAANGDHSSGICIWTAPSVDSVREVVESLLGQYSTNDYIQLDEMDGLPALA